MGTFDGQTITDTSGQIYHDTLDPSTMNFGNLGLTDGVINSPAPFGSKYTSLKGTDIKLVHGDRWQELEGLLTENIAQGIATTIGAPGNPAGKPSSTPGFWTINQQGDQVVTIYGSVTQQVNGTKANLYTWTGPVTETFGGTVTQNYASPVHIHQPASAPVFTWTDQANQGYHLKYQVCDYQVQFNCWTFNMVSSKILTQLAVPDDSSSSGQSNRDQADSDGGAGGQLPVFATPGLSITVNTGLNLSVGLVNLVASVIKSKAGATSIDIGPFIAKIGAALVHVLATAQAGPHVGAPTSLGAN